MYYFFYFDLSRITTNTHSHILRDLQLKTLTFALFLFGALGSVLLTRHHSGERYLVWEKRSAYRVLVGKPEGKGNMEDSGVNGRVILKWIFERLDGSIDWIDLTQDSDRWRALVNAAMNLRVPSSAGNV
jgi:hypothetical protein